MGGSGGKPSIQKGNPGGSGGHGNSFFSADQAGRMTFLLLIAVVLQVLLRNLGAFKLSGAQVKEDNFMAIGLIMGRRTLRGGVK